jgi:hypothetical protein
MVAGRELGFDPAMNAHTVHAAVHSYRQRMAAFAEMSALEVFYARVSAFSRRPLTSSWAGPWDQGDATSTSDSPRIRKGSAVIEAMTQDDLVTWGRLCSWALARGHARSGDPVAIASYLGDDNEVDHALADFAAAYADQNEKDHSALVARSNRAA